MSLSQETREKMVTYLQSSSKFHGEFKYPDWAFEFAKQARQETVEMPPVNGHPYKLYIFTPDNKPPNQRFPLECLAGPPDPGNRGGCGLHPVRGCALAHSPGTVPGCRTVCVCPLHPVGM